MLSDKEDSVVTLGVGEGWVLHLHGEGGFKALEAEDGAAAAAAAAAAY